MLATIQLVQASKDGDIETVRALLAHPNVDVDASDPSLSNGYTPLLYAVSKERVEVVKMLLQGGADPSAPSAYGTSPLHAGADNAEIVEMLLKASADPSVTDADGSTPLHFAARRGNDEVVDMLLKASVDPNAADQNGVTPLHEASGKRRTYTLELLVQAGADVNAADKVRQVECGWKHDGRTALHRAVYRYQTGRAYVVESLIKLEADLSVVDKEGLEPFHVCLKCRDFETLTNAMLETLKVLITYGAKWDTKCDEMVAAKEAREDALVLRLCVLVWSQEYADGLPFTKVDLSVLQRGPEHTQVYIDELKKSKETKHRRKICLVGPSNAGKTSLVKSLTARQPLLVHPDDRTIGVDHFVLRFGVELPGDKTYIHEVTFWDFAGQDEYQVAHSLYFSARTLYLVCVDLEAFVVAYMQADLMANSKTQCEQLMNEFIERDILRWVRVIFSQQPDAEFVFIATKDDLLVEPPKFISEAKAFLAKKLGQVEGIVDEMKRELVEHVSEGMRRADTLTIHAYEKRVEERDSSAFDEDTKSEDASCEQFVEHVPVVDQVGKQTTNLLAKFAWGRRVCQQMLSTVKSRTRITFKPSEVPAMKLTSLDAEVRVKRELLFVSCSNMDSVEKARRDIIALIVKSNRCFVMPDSFTDVLNAVVKMRQNTTNTKSDSRVGYVFTPVDSLVPSLMAMTAVIKKEACLSILRTLHDLGDVLWYESLGIELFRKSVILDPLLLIDFVRQVINHRHKAEKLAHAELKGLPFWVSLTGENQFLALKQVLEKFQLVHPSVGEMKWNSDLIVPAFWKSKTPASWLFGYEDVRLVSSMRCNDPNRPEERMRVHWQYHFAHEFPDTLCDHLIVATYSPMMVRDVGPDWILYANDGIFACRAMVSRDGKTVQRVLQLEAVLAKTANKKKAIEMWEAFERLSQGIVTVLHRYPGLVVTSVALDEQNEMHDLESLFDFQLSEQSRAWMPRAKSWGLYKRHVGSGGKA